ncbi:hypothetical protein ACHAXR_012308, partial [Thalassiosira sp. AJA248-18]
ATLSLPAAAAGTGVISGDGTNFVLEAPTHIIEQLIESESQQQQQQQQQQKQPCIEGVVNLEVASHLVKGISEEEFIGMLHHDVPHAPRHHRQNTPIIPMEPVDEVSASPATAQRNDEEKGLQWRQSANVKEFQSGEDHPLLSSSYISADKTTACMSLSADPFVHTLAQVVTPGNQDKKLGEEGEDVTVVETIDASGNDFHSSFLHRDHHNADTGATMAREAFLLSVPARGAGPSGVSGSNYSGVSSAGGVNLETGDAFVLALPEMAEQPKEENNDKPVEMKGGIVGSFLRHSVTNVAETVAGVAIEMDHAFHPLPTDVQHVNLRVSIVPAFMGKGKGNEEEEVHLDLVVDRQVPVIGYVILVSGLIALSSIGAALDLQQGGVTPEMKILWRLSSTSLLFLWLAAKKLNREEFARFTWKQLCVEMPFAAANYAAMNAGFAVSLEMTSMVNAFILSNMASLLMIGSKFCLGIPVLFFEGLGALIGFAGALICAAAGGGDDNMNEDHRLLQNASLEMTGNVLAFSASITTAVYLTVAKRLRPQVDLVLFMFLIFTFATIFLLVYIIFYSGQEYEFSSDPRIGVFGWINRQADRLPLELYVAIVCNGVGTMGYIAIMKYFDPVVVSMVMLMEPIIVAFIGKAVGVSTLPGWVTWAGDAVVMVGSIMVIWSGSRTTETIDATDALHEIESEAETPKLTKSPRLMKSPLVVNKQRKESEDMEFVCVGKKAKMHSAGRDEQRVIWSSLKRE